MDSPSSHPRRRPQKGTHARPPSLPGSPKASLRKVETFHVPSRRLSSSSMIDPVADAVYIPKRSPTSSKALESLIAPRAHVTKFLADLDNTLAGLVDASVLNNAEVWAVPNVVLEHTDIDDRMDIDDDNYTDEKPIADDHHHDSDSGLGSSIDTITSSIKSVGTAINKSYSAPSSTGTADLHSLSDYAAKEIKLRILDPILKKEDLEAFHPLLTDVPRRINSSEIKNLRDLEKNLLLLAFDSAPSAASYQRFCEETVTCILATVDHLPEADQRSPTDRPFTNSYALDLIDQIRRYAQIMAETRARQEAGKPLDEAEYSPDEELTIEGGLSKNGKPAQLVRMKNGKSIPIAAPEQVEAIEKLSPMKRSFSEDPEGDLDEATRSMARRRKSDRPGDVIHSCRDCGKEFKRPCDLTKHEKTHARPWKCPERTCKYHTEGWPTEKECERHVNDRHNTNPSLYKCTFTPCTYTSKRESNCKQHMEKSHGYTYVRSKNNGRNKSGPSPASGATPATPLTPIINTPASVLMSTPATPFAASPALPNFDWNFPAMQPTPMLPPSYPSNARRPSAATSSSAMTTSSTHSPFDKTDNSFEDNFATMQPAFNNTMDFDLHPSLGNSAGLGFQPVNFNHPPTPAMSYTHSPLDFNPTLSVNTNVNSTNGTHLSPTGQGDATLLSPHSHDYPIDEGFGDDLIPASDFTLFDTAPTTTFDDAMASGALFSDMNNYNDMGGGQFFDDVDFGFGNN